MEDNLEESCLSDDEAAILFEEWKQHISEYVQNNTLSTNTHLFSILALLNAYVPESYLCMEECQKILGPPDPIDGGPPFEERMNPFINLLNPIPQQVRIIHPVIAQRSVELLGGLNISRSAIVRRCMVYLCGVQPQSDVITFIKDLLTRREMGERGKEKFSKLIADILEQEHFYQAAQVLKMASSKFRQKHIFPQTVARLYYVGKMHPDYEEAEGWAKTAIRRAQNNSYVADTLGQVYKNRLLRRARQQGDVVQMAHTAFVAFKDVEEKAENEEGPEMNEIAGTVNISTFFNNRGLFGFIQVAKIVIDKLGETVTTTCFPNLETEVEEKFDFFEWYLCYSTPDVATVEPDYFWKDVVLCYESYTEKEAADSTSFPGLLDCLNHGLFTSKGKRAGFQETEKPTSTLETVRQVLKIAYEENVDDVKMAERYILSNIIVSNRMPNSPERTLVRDLQGIIHSFLRSEVGRRSPEFYLLALLLYWPEEMLQVQQVDEELEQQSSEDDELQDRTWDAENVYENQDTGGESAQLSPDHTFDPDLQQFVSFMDEAFEKTGYAKYLRGRYLLPLFFLGKDSGLSRWIHKSRLDAIVERKVDAELVNARDRNREKKKRINDLWQSGQVWHVQEIRDILSPVQVEPCRPSAEDDEEEMFVWAGRKKIKARIQGKTDGPPQSPMLFYLAFNIRGPVVFKVGAP